MGKKTTPYVPQMALGARVSLVRGESAACEEVSHLWRNGSVFLGRRVYIKLAVQMQVTS